MQALTRSPKTTYNEPSKKICDMCNSSNILYTPNGLVVCGSCGIEIINPDIIDQVMVHEHFRPDVHAMLNNVPISKYGKRSIDTPFKRFASMPSKESRNLAQRAKYLKNMHIDLSERKSTLHEAYHFLKSTLSEMSFFTSTIDNEISRIIRKIFRKSPESFLRKKGNFSVRTIYVIAASIHLYQHPNFIENLFLKDLKKLFPEVDFAEIDCNVYKTMRVFAPHLRFDPDPLISKIQNFAVKDAIKSMKLDKYAWKSINTFINQFNPKKIGQRSEREFNAAFARKHNMVWAPRQNMRSLIMVHNKTDEVTSYQKKKISSRSYEMAKKKFMLNYRNSSDYLNNVLVYYFLTSVRDCFYEVTVKLQKKFILLFTAVVYDLVHDYKKFNESMKSSLKQKNVTINKFAEINYTLRQFAKVMNHPDVSINSMRAIRRRIIYKDFYRIIEKRLSKKLFSDLIESDYCKKNAPKLTLQITARYPELMLSNDYENITEIEKFEKILKRFLEPFSIRDRRHLLSLPAEILMKREEFKTFCDLFLKHKRDWQIAVDRMDDKNDSIMMLQFKAMKFKG